MVIDTYPQSVVVVSVVSVGEVVPVRRVVVTHLARSPAHGRGVGRIVRVGSAQVHTWAVQCVVCCRIRPSSEINKSIIGLRGHQSLL